MFPTSKNFHAQFLNNRETKRAEILYAVDYLSAEFLHQFGPVVAKVERNDYDFGGVK